MKPSALPLRIGLLLCELRGPCRTATGASAQTERSAEQALTEARAAADTDRHEEAILAYREALGGSPQDHPDWHLELADQLTWASRLDEAVPAYEAVITSDREDLRKKAFTGLGRALSWQGDYAQAVEAFDNATGNRPARLGGGDAARPDPVVGPSASRSRGGLSYAACAKAGR